ncbi:uncharacterized protein N7458_005177 [Penicillium daleae]|uniref:Uncharacterized protein n=1 Tax=Penicillium daleae TaxID=63821 RepID=A0AAD6C8D9_9EURO|nr:uncharacterized protein N7458_005177 [Penicillium daleae]KAJ5454221.1 hypothetical protein N7458_005177 [Penicillium daleae]
MSDIGQGPSSGPPGPTQTIAHGVIHPQGRRPSQAATGFPGQQAAPFQTATPQTHSTSASDMPMTVGMAMDLFRQVSREEL